MSNQTDKNINPRYSEQALKAYGADIALFAGEEGLSGHARSVTKRLEDM